MGHVLVCMDVQEVHLDIFFVNLILEYAKTPKVIEI